MTSDSELVTLAECPPGPFEFNGSLGFKTEYGMSLPDGPTEVPGDQIRWKVTHWPEAYCMDSGEAFWGGAKTHEERAKLLVLPVDVARPATDDVVERDRFARAKAEYRALKGGDDVDDEAFENALAALPPSQGEGV